MPATANALRWNGSPGHYEVYYLTLTDPASGVGVWIRYTMVAPLPETGEPPSCALWFLVMDPRAREIGSPTLGRKRTFAIEELHARADPFELRIGEATLSDQAMEGGFEDVAWTLRWERSAKAYEHVHPLLWRLGVAKTVLVLAHADLEIRGGVSFGGKRLELDRARGGQAHIWGSKHATTWAWVHCNDLRTEDGEPALGTFVDGVSVFVPRFGRVRGPNTPVVGRVSGSDFLSTSPLRVLSNRSEFELTRWRFEAVSGSRKLVGEVRAERELLAGVTYHDPDGEPAYCYNSETASMRLEVHERSRNVTTLLSSGRAHFEYAQRTPLPGIELLTR